VILVDFVYGTASAKTFGFLTSGFFTFIVNAFPTIFYIVIHLLTVRAEPDLPLILVFYYTGYATANGIPKIRAVRGTCITTALVCIIAHFTAFIAFNILFIRVIFPVIFVSVKTAINVL